MKIIKLSIITAIMAIALLACKKAAMLDIVFTMPQATIGYFSVDTTLSGGDITITTTKNINLDSLAKTKNTDISKLKSVTPEIFGISIVEPKDENFDNLQSGTIFISTAEKPTPIEVASFSTSNINPGAKYFYCNLKDKDLNILDYAKSNLTVTCKITTKSGVKKPMIFLVYMTCKAVANPTN